MVLSQDGVAKSPLSYRILEREKVTHDRDGNANKVRQLYLQVSLEEGVPEVTTRKAVGALGVDLNADHFAIGEVNRSGNPARGSHLPIQMEGKTSQQINAQFGNHIIDIVAYAKLNNKPIAVEKLDFRAKKSALRETSVPRMARLLSLFSYSQFMLMLESRCRRDGVGLLKVNPAFSSVLGALNYIGLRHLYTSH
mgnify:CR=1 FL=1